MRAAGLVRGLARIAPAATVLAGAEAPARRGAPEWRSLYVTVEKDGGLISGLTGKNFRLYEDGDLRPFGLEKPERPASVALLVEYSRSSWLYFNDIENAVTAFLGEAPEGHWYALAVFSDILKIEVDFTKQKGRQRAAFADLGRPRWADVNTYDAVFEMLVKLDRLPGRRVLVFIGSGLDSLSSRSLEEVRAKLERVNIAVYSLALGSQLRGSYEPYLGSLSRLRLLQAEAFHRMLANKTGGEAWSPRFDTGFADVMRRIMQSVAHQYHLMYESRAARDGKFHRLKLEAFQVTDDRREDFQVRVREGFRLGS